MYDRNSLQPRTLPLARAAALAVVLTLSLAQGARAERVSPPPVPFDLKVDEGSEGFLVGHATGTQNYICLPQGLGFAWSLFTPEATLFSNDGKQLITHFFSPNPDPSEAGTIRAAWQSSRDTSTVWAKLKKASTDSQFVAEGAIPWLLLDVVGTQTGPTGGDSLGQTHQIQRLNTVGGSAPPDGCAGATDVGKKAFIPYTADYFFFSNPNAQ